VIVTLIPAAGFSRRMKGRDKLMMPLRGQPILKRVIQEALAANLGPVIVALRPAEKLRQSVLQNLPVNVVEVENADEGMSASFRAGANAALQMIESDDRADQKHSGMFIQLPDMPEIYQDDLIDLNNAFQSSDGAVVRAKTESGHPGHPVLFPEQLLSKFEGLTGDVGAAELLRDAETCFVTLSGERARLDLDTPEDWDAWCKKHNV